jgi:hypothetical protein
LKDGACSAVVMTHSPKPSCSDGLKNEGTLVWALCGGAQTRVGLEMGRHLRASSRPG